MRVLPSLLAGLVWLASVWLASVVPSVQAQERTSWQQWTSAPTWVFLGDSNTYSGGTVSVLDAWLQQANVQPRPKLLNLGVPSETASGLSEVDHPFKRPCIHERLDKVLAMLRPQVVFVSYGMNDGIYQPPSAEVLDAYKAGMLKLAAAVHELDAKLIVLTPPIFEAEPVRQQGKLGPTADGRYAYFAPAENYDETLQQQATWLNQNPFGADAIVDVHEALAAAKQQKLVDQPEFAFSKDGVHYGGEAHALVAEAILKALGASPAVLAAYPEDTALKQATRAMKLRRDAYISATGKNRPGLPAGLPVWQVEQMLAP